MKLTFFLYKKNKKNPRWRIQDGDLFQNNKIYNLLFYDKNCFYAMPMLDVVQKKHLGHLHAIIIIFYLFSICNDFWVVPMHYG